MLRDEILMLFWQNSMVVVLRLPQSKLFGGRLFASWIPHVSTLFVVTAERDEKHVLRRVGLWGQLKDIGECRFMLFTSGS